MPKILSVIKVDVVYLKSNPVQLSITAHGMASTPGWTNVRLDSSIDRDADDEVLEYELLGDRPGGILPQVLTPVTASTVYSGEDAETIAAVIVSARTNQVVSNLGPMMPSFTTFSLGEEETITNPRVDDPTTKRLGEEGPITDPRFDDPIGPDIPVTTLALGEENGPITNPRVDDPTTKRLGEEGLITDPRFDDPIGPDIPVTTLAIGEENGPITTLALGEESRGGFGGGSFGGGNPFGSF